MAFVDRADARLEPIPLARCRELLGEDAEALTDEEVALIRRHRVRELVLQAYAQHEQEATEAAS